MTTCLVLGGADCVWQDVADFWTMMGDRPASGNVSAPEVPWDGVIACNDIGAEWPGRLDAWCSIHGNYFHGKGWISKRRENGLSTAERYYTCREKYAQDFERDNGFPIRVTDWRFPEQTIIEDAFSSGILAAKIALVDREYDMAVLCGVPLTNTPHFFEEKSWEFGTKYARRLNHIPDEYRKRIRSMSGMTRKFFKSPLTELPSPAGSSH